MFIVETFALRQIIHELFLKHSFKKEEVREIIEFEKGEIILATFDYDDKHIKIVAQERKDGTQIFEKIITKKEKFQKTLSIASYFESKLKRMWEL